MTAAQVKQYYRDILLAQRTIAQEILSLDAIVDLVAQALTEDIPEWTALLTFQTDGTDAGSYCIWADTDGKIRFWKTLVDDNLNNEPPTNPLTTFDAFWIEVSPSDGSAIKEWAPGIYGPGLVIVYHDVEGDGTDPALYLLTEATRPFESTNFLTELLAGQWKKLGIYPITVSTAGATITLDMKGGTQKRFEGSATIAANKAVAFDNEANGQEIKLFMAIDAAGRQLTFENTVKMRTVIADWDGATFIWTAPEAGAYECTLSHNGANWLMKIEGPF